MPSGGCGKVKIIRHPCGNIGHKRFWTSCDWKRYGRWKASNGVAV